MTGPNPVGNRRLFISDPRKDNFTNVAPRKISVTAWYPTSTTGPVARYLSAVNAYDNTMASQITNGIEVPGWFTPQSQTMYPNVNQRDTRAVLNGDVRTDLGLLPVVIFSPGFGVPGNCSSILAQELASHGYLVLTTSCTYESVCTEWSNGVINQNAGYVGNQWAKTLAARVADVRCLLGQISALPNGIGAQADVDKVAVVGHSYGGTTGMEAAYQEPVRIKAVALLDGPVGYAGTTNLAQNNGIPQPVMLLSGPVNASDGFTTGAEMAGWSTYAATNHGPLHRYQVAGARHYAFTDVGLLTKKPATLLGTIGAARAMEMHPRWTRAFLDTYVRGVPDPLLTLPAVDWPEVTAI
ncbi:hypothetical protein FG87_21645 [Nocardia vulneris]|uniref:AB hydrolase-1 domain-containing protein n=2 Tax=Nocardia vulneris TaxID=1141657 RepID=A0ABR4ZCA3_9NOCA|nr:hypothetical protein FG87_21645 [Nocardia vulneris]